MQNDGRITKKWHKKNKKKTLTGVFTDQVIAALELVNLFRCENYRICYDYLLKIIDYKNINEAKL